MISLGPASNFLLTANSGLVYLEMSRLGEVPSMPAMKLSPKIDEKTWNDFKAVSREVHQADS
jgi:hypothetical protein